MHHCGSETFIWSVCTFHCKCFPGRPGLNHIPLGAHCVPVYDCDSVPSAKSWRGWDEMLTRLCRAVPCCLFHPVINKAQSSVMGPVGPQSILADGRGAANGSRCKPWPSFSPARPSLPAPPGYSGREALGHPPPGKRCPVHHRLGLIVSGLEDTLHGAALRRPIMVAYALHDLWHPRQRLFLASEQRLDQLLLCFYFPSPLRCRNWPPSGSPWPGQAGGFQNEWGAAG